MLDMKLVWRIEQTAFPNHRTYFLNVARTKSMSLEQIFQTLKILELAISVDYINSDIVWDWSEIQGARICFV